jgi:trigger factor
VTQQFAAGAIIDPARRVPHVKSTVEHLNPTRVKLTVEVGFDELKPHFDKAYRTLAGQVRIPGFRPGKVPARILDARLGRGTILTEVVNEAVPAKYGEAVTAEQLAVLGQPDIEISKIEDGDVVEFTAEVDVRPDIALPAVGEVSVTVDDVQVTEEEIDEQVQALRERFASTTAVDRPAADGDLVTLDLRAAIDGTELPDATADGLSYRVGSGELVEGIDEAITGLSAGESATFSSTLLAGAHSGEEAQITATVTAVSERELPETDDDFAQLASEFDTVEELRADLAEKIRRVKNLSQGADARDKVLEALLGMTEIPVPEGIVQSEVAARQHEAVRPCDHDEPALAAHLESIGQTREELDADIRTSAEEAVRTQLLLDALADATGVTVSQEEFTERLMYNAQRFGVGPDEYLRRLQEAGQLGAVFAEVRRGKALMAAVQQATVRDESGTVLDVAALFGVEPDDGDEVAPDAGTAEQPAGDSEESGTDSVTDEGPAEADSVADEASADADSVTAGESADGSEQHTAPAGS